MKFSITPMSSMVRSSFKAALLCALFGASSACADIAATWNGTTGNWTDAARWNTNPVFPNNSAPAFYDAAISAGEVTLNQNITLNQLALGGGTLAGSFTLALAEGIAWSGGSLALTGGGRVTLGAGTASSVSGSPVFTSGRIVGGGGATFSIPSGATLAALNNASFFADIGNPSWTLNNAGTLISRATSGAGFTSIDAVCNNTGIVRVELAGGTAQTLSLAGGGTHSGGFDLAADTALEFGGRTILQGGVAITGGGMAFIAGEVLLAGNISASNLTIAIGTLNLGGQIATVAGSGLLVQDDGTLTGSGTLNAGLASYGTIAPGSGVGTLNVSGGATFGTEAQLAIEIVGASFDVLAISGSAALDGELLVSFPTGSTPAFGASFTILTATIARSGVFANAPADGGSLATVDGRGSFTIHYLPNAVVLDQFVRNANFVAPQIAREPGGGWRVSFTGKPAQTYAIQFTPRLLPADWQTLGTATADAQGRYFLIDVPPAGTAHRFYRSLGAVIASRSDEGRG